MEVYDIPDAAEFLQVFIGVYRGGFPSRERLALS